MVNEDALRPSQDDIDENDNRSPRIIRTLRVLKKCRAVIWEGTLEFLFPERVRNQNIIVPFKATTTLVNDEPSV